MLNIRVFHLFKISHSICIGLILICIFNSCSKKTNESQQSDVVARVGSSVITTDDFKYRAGLTVRPSSVKTVNAVLNNLIAEKLLAMEAGDTCALIKSHTFQAHIQGIREQSIREQLYNEVAVKQVHLKEDEIRQTYELSQRVYELEFFTINNPKIIDEVESQLASGQNVNNIFKELSELGESGFQTVKWKDPESDNIHRALYGEAYDIGEIVGPIRIAPIQWIMMRVLDINRHPIIGQEDRNVRMNEVIEKLTDLKAKNIWQKYKDTMMQGKEMKFEQEAFHQIVQWYLEDHHNLQDGDVSQIQEGETDTQLNVNTPDKLETILDQPFFRLDGQTWTVGDFKRAIMSHPLVYRKKDFPPNQFPTYFKQAIADLIVDHYLNKEAYRRGLDKQSEIQRKGKLWSDSYLARYRINQYLKEINIQELQKKDHTYYGPRVVNEYLTQLNMKYADQIEINDEYINQLSLNKLPIFVLQPGMPYPVAVPGFPHYTNADTLLFAQE
ncbi:hypothetical protein ACFL4L_01955 [bacterium]